MDIRLIVFGMLAVLAVLFIGAKFYIPREQNKAKFEAEYALAVQNFHKSQTLEAYNSCYRVLEAAFQGDQEKVKNRLLKDRIERPS